MNVKKILSSICALVCASFFVVQQPIEARSAEQQEESAYRFAMKRFGRIPSVNDSDFSRKFSPILQRLQKRICDVNNIEMTTQKYSTPNDYKTKIHPVIAVDNFNNSTAQGAGYIYIGNGTIKDYTWSSMVVSNQYSCMGLTNTIAHEIGHNIAGHHMKSHESDFEDELEAERLSIKLTDKLPEGGWGTYLANITLNLNRPEQNFQIIESFEEATNGITKIRADGSRWIVNYKSNSGKIYQLTATLDDCRDVADSYFGGQIAYCIAKGALTPGSLQVVENHLKDEIKFNAEYLLICRSSKLPNGYRVLTEIDGHTTDYWNDNIKELLATPSLFDKYYEEAYAVAKKQNLVPGWCVWLACAVAQDFAGRNR